MDVFHRLKTANIKKYSLEAFSYNTPWSILTVTLYNDEHVDLIVDILRGISGKYVISWRPIKETLNNFLIAFENDDDLVLVRMVI